MFAPVNNPPNPGPISFNQQAPIRAGSLPVSPRIVKVGNQDLLTAIESTLRNDNGGKFPPGTTMTAKYDKDNLGAIKASIYSPEGGEAALFSFKRTFTVVVPGQEPYTFEKEIFTNVPVPTVSSGPEEYEKALQIAAMAASGYSKMCNDAILVKGGGDSKQNLDTGKIQLLQKQTFIVLGMKISDIKTTRLAELHQFEVKMGDKTSAFTLDQSSEKGTSLRTRHKSFVITNPTVDFAKYRVSTFKKFQSDPNTLLKHYLDPSPDNADAKAVKDAHENRRDKNQFRAARIVFQEGGHPALKPAYAQYGADLSSTLNEIKSSIHQLETEKTSGWKSERSKLEAEAKTLEKMLNDLRSDWPGLNVEISTVTNTPVNQDQGKLPFAAPRAPDAAAQKRAALKMEANDLGIDPSLHMSYVNKKLLIEESNPKLAALNEEVKTNEATLAKNQALIGKANVDPALKVALEAENKALDELLRIQKPVRDRLQFQVDAYQLDLEVIQINGNDLNFIKDGTVSADAQAKVKESKVKMDKAAQLPQEIPPATKKAHTDASATSQKILAELEAPFLHYPMKQDTIDRLTNKYEKNKNQIQALEELHKKEVDEHLKKSLENRIKLHKILLEEQLTTLNAMKSIYTTLNEELGKFRDSGYANKDQAIQDVQAKIKASIDTYNASLGKIRESKKAIRFEIDKFDKLVDLTNEVKRTNANIVLLNAELKKHKKGSDEFNKYNTAIANEKEYLKIQQKLVKIQSSAVVEGAKGYDKWKNGQANAEAASKRLQAARDKTAKPLLEEIARAKAPPAAPQAPREPAKNHPLNSDNDDSDNEDSWDEEQ